MLAAGLELGPDGHLLRVRVSPDHNSIPRVRVRVRVRVKVKVRIS